MAAKAEWTSKNNSKIFKKKKKVIKSPYQIIVFDGQRRFVELRCCPLPSKTAVTALTSCLLFRHLGCRCLILSFKSTPRNCNKVHLNARFTIPPVSSNAALLGPLILAPGEIVKSAFECTRRPSKLVNIIK